MANILEVKNLQKSFKNLKAVNNISFSIQSGTCFGLLGPNGAGKTTTLEIIENIRKADSGEILFEGKIRDHNFSENIGLQTQSTEIFDKLTVKESLETFSSFYKNPESLTTIVQTCRLEDILNRPVSKLSGGQKQRVFLAIALVNKPELLFLDEPTTGLDPQARRYLWDIVKDIKKSGKSILLTTHYLEEAYQLCDRIAIMDHGKILVEGQPQELLRKYFKGSIITLPINYENIISKNFEKFEKNETHIEIVTENPNQTIAELLQLNIDLNEVSIRSKNLEDLFVELTGKELRG